MVCMYCGAPATATTEWRETNHPPGPRSNNGGGTDLSPTPTGDDPISGLMLPVVLWELLEGLVAGVGAAVGYPGTVERAIVFTVEAWDVNCPQHIHRRFPSGRSGR